MIRTLWHEVAGLRGHVEWRELIGLPPWKGYRLTAKRLLNLYRVRYQYVSGRTAVRGMPVKLTIEPTSACNLQCPGCFTGIDEVGRQRGAMSLELYRSLLAELGDYLFELEFYNWGEPLLAKQLPIMIREAHDRGISTTVSTNFSIPFDAEKAERLVASGLTVLGVSIDGARQESYEQYRVRGELALVLKNCRLITDAKRKLGSRTPRLVWEFHVFEHNHQDVELAQQMARDLDMDICVSKGWNIGAEWNPGGEWQFFGKPRPVRCPFLWGFAVVNNDGGVSPCCGTFYSEDDMGRVSGEIGRPDGTTFREVWNGERFQAARGFYRRRDGSEEARAHVCHDCPNTILHEEWREHRAAGGDARSFQVRFTMNDVVNYFWNRRPGRRQPAGEARRAAR